MPFMSKESYFENRKVYGAENYPLLLLLTGIFIIQYTMDYAIIAMYAIYIYIYVVSTL